MLQSENKTENKNMYQYRFELVKTNIGNKGDIPIKGDSSDVLPIYP